MKNEADNLPAAARAPRLAPETTDVLAELHNNLSNDLDRIKRRFNGAPRLTLVVRFENEPDKGLWLTDDTKEGMISQCEFLERKAARIFEAKTGPLAQGGRTPDAAGRY